jgi:hypothetical protein
MQSTSPKPLRQSWDRFTSLTLISIEISLGDETGWNMASRRNDIESRRAGLSSAEGSRKGRGAQQQHPDTHKARCRPNGIRYPTNPCHPGHS